MNADPNQALNVQQQQSMINVDSFLMGGAQQAMDQNPGGLMRHSSYNIGGSSVPAKAIADIDYKRGKVNVYMASSIFSKCANPSEQEEIKDLSTKENEDDESE